MYKILYFLFPLMILSIDNPEEFINLLAGTFTDGNSFSTGNTLPLIGLPWGFNHWSLQTIEDRGQRTGSWWFSGSAHSLSWLRCTHQPSPWIGDWGWFLFTPMIGEITRSPMYFYQPRGSIIKPYLLDLILSPNNIRVQLSPTNHCAALKVTFPTKDSNVYIDKSINKHVNNDRERNKYICFAECDWGVHERTDGISYITATSNKVNTDRSIVANFKLYIHITSEHVKSIEQSNDLLCFSYDKELEDITIYISTSLISLNQAKLNYENEINGLNFDNVYSNAKNIWNKLLKRVDVMPPNIVTEEFTRHVTIFYSSLYRALMFPRRLDEVNANGEVVHYSPYDPQGGTHAGPLCTDNGFWDTFRTVYPMLSLLYPDYLGDVIQGWLNAYKEGGWLPSWASPGYRNCMVGTYADVVIADAIVKDINGFDLQLAYEALIKDAYETPPSYAGNAYGKEGLNEYKDKGYIPREVSRTLDFGFADFSTAKAIDSLITSNNDYDIILSDELISKYKSQVKELIKRSERAYTSQYDKVQGLMVPKENSGMISSITDIEWGNGYTEGNAWHFAFPPYAFEPIDKLTNGLPSKLSDSKNFITPDLLYNKLSTSENLNNPRTLNKLYELFLRDSHFRPGSYHQEIHEMTEARAFAMGQYAHNNQPSHHIPYLFSVLGDKATGDKLIRVILDRGYGTDFFAGDEDNGEMGAWFVLSALGLFVITPGTRNYVLGSPIFEHVKIFRGFNDNNKYTYEKYDVPTSKLKQTNYLPFRHKTKSDSKADSITDSKSKYLHIISLQTNRSNYITKKILYYHFNESNYLSTYPSSDLTKDLTNYLTIDGVTIIDPLIQLGDTIVRFIVNNEIDRYIDPFNYIDKPIDSKLESTIDNKLDNKIDSKINNEIDRIINQQLKHKNQFNQINQNDSIESLTMTYDIYLLLLIFLILSIYLSSKLLQSLGITKNISNYNDVLGFDKSFQKSPAHLV